MSRIVFELDALACAVAAATICRYEPKAADRLVTDPFVGDGLKAIDARLLRAIEAYRGSDAVRGRIGALDARRNAEQAGLFQGRAA